MTYIVTVYDDRDRDKLQPGSALVETESLDTARVALAHYCTTWPDHARHIERVDIHDAAGTLVESREGYNL